MAGKSIEDLNKAEKKFVHTYTRSLLVQWGRETLIQGHFDFTDDEQLFVDYALSKSWVSKTLPRSVISSGFSTASGILK